MVNFTILFTAHLLGDFYLQTSKIAKCKNANTDTSCNGCTACKKGSEFNLKYLFIHILLYIIPFGVLFFSTDFLKALTAVILIAVTHSITDVLSCCLNKKFKHTAIFVTDQFLHVIILFILCKYFYFSFPFEKYYTAIKVIFTVLLLTVPPSVFINKLFEDLYHETNTDIFDTGSLIGILERFLVIIFAYFENFAAIAIIITVKTWARTNDLKETNFRNKYLLGTLASLVSALCAYMLFKII